jgi:SAM-dependent methyltransferase
LIADVDSKDAYKRFNRRAWEQLAHGSSESSIGFDQLQLERSSEWLDPWGWIPWETVASVLCLASGGGQQAPSFAYLGYETFLLDLSPAQMEVDQGDMLDLSSLGTRRFDLVYQPVSACYVPSARQLYEQVATVLKPGGYYRVEHWNPYQMQMDPGGAWDGVGYRLVEPQGSEPVPLPWTLTTADGQRRFETLCHYIHPLHDLIGGLCDAGFAILRYAERLRGDVSARPGTYPHLRSYAPSFFTMLAQVRKG